MRMSPLSQTLCGLGVAAAALAPAPAGESTQSVENPEKAVVCRWADNKRAVFFLAFDDSCHSQVVNAIPELRKRGLTGTFYVNPGTGHFPWDKAKWEKDIPAAGMVLGNHTMNHKGVSDAAELDRELADCNAAIAKCRPAAPAPRFIPFGQPGGVPWKVSGDEFAAALAKHHLVNRPPFAGPPFQYKTREATLAVIDRTLQGDGIGHLDFHGVGGDWHSVDLDDFRAVLDRLAAVHDRLWITDPASCHQYQTERDGARLAVAGESPEKVTLRLTCATDPGLYDHPLTLRARVPAAWKQCEVLQNGEKNVVPVRDGWAQFPAAPRNGAIELTPAPDRP